MIPKDAIRISVTNEVTEKDGKPVETGHKFIGAHLRMDEWSRLDREVLATTLGDRDRAMKDLQHRLRVAMWRDIYGDIKDRVVRLRMEVLTNIPPGRADRAEQLLNELLGMLADPEKPKEDQ